MVFAPAAQKERVQSRHFQMQYYCWREIKHTMGNLLLLLVAIIIAAIRIIKKGPLIYKPDWYSDKKPVLDPG